MRIQNGKDTPLNENTGTVPQMADALQSWFQPMVFGIVSKVVINSVVVETKTSVSFQGVWQPFTETQLQLLPRGQRDWTWFMVHSTPELVLQTDMLITYLGTQYRVMKIWPYELYGYRQYDLIEDFTGGGPT